MYDVTIYILPSEGLSKSSRPKSNAVGQGVSSNLCLKVFLSKVMRYDKTSNNSHNLFLKYIYIYLYIYIFIFRTSLRPKVKNDPLHLTSLPESFPSLQEK